MDGMGDAWRGAKTDVMHDVWMCCTDDAQMGATTDIMHDVQMDCMDDAQTGAPKGVMYDVLMVGDLTRFSFIIYCIFLPIITGDFRWVCRRQ